jgi:phage baseplate assembly protein W
MLPVTGDILEQDFKVIEQPSKTFRLVMNSGRIMGMVDGLESIRQSVYCILNTERFDWLIYSWNYGVELNRLFGKPLGLVKAKVKKRIKEALKQDDRIIEVDNFSFKESGKSLSVTFTVQTPVGEIDAEKEVNF